MKKSILRQIVKHVREAEAGHPEFRYKHFSFIIQGNAIVEVGMNRTATPLTQHGFPPHGKLHAETEAYRKARGILAPGDFDCVNVRIKNGQLKLSAPCQCCYAFLRNAGCSRIYFSTDTQEFAKL
jgi:tRNA(Arg) A34 adenosine deaminase TadA